MRLTRLLSAACILASPLLFAFNACGHPQSQGVYALSTREIITDPCQLVIDAGTVGRGTLVIRGDDLRMDDFQFQGLGMAMVGAYDKQVEAFYMDGSAANLSAVASGQECLVNLVTMHLEGTTDDPDHFHGTLRVSYQAPNQTSCTCQASLGFQAAVQP